MPTWPCSAAFLNNVSASASCSDRRARTVLRRLRPCGISAYPRPSTPGRVSKCPAGGRVPHCSGTTRPIWRCRRRAPDGTRRCRTSLSSGMYQPRCERQPRNRLASPHETRVTRGGVTRTLSQCSSHQSNSCLSEGAPRIACNLDTGVVIVSVVLGFVMGCALLQTQIRAQTLTDNSNHLKMIQET